MSKRKQNEELANLQEQLDTAKSALEEHERRYNITIIDLAQILRAPDRAKAGLPPDQLTDQHPVFNREFDPPLLQAIKRTLHRMAQAKADTAKRLREQNPSRNPDTELIAALFQEICDEAEINGERLPGRRKLQGLAQRMARELGMSSEVSEYAAGKFLKHRASKEAGGAD